MRRRVTLAAILALLAFGGFTFVAVSPSLHDIDRDVGAAVQDARHPLLESPMRVVTFLGSGWTLALLTAVTSAMLIGRRDRMAARLPVMILGSAVAEWLVKWLVSRPRPRGSLSAFPSGHVFTSVVFFGAVIYLLWTRDVARPWRVVGTALCVLLVAGVAVSRMYLKFHWLTDVLGGVAGGAAYLLIALMIADPRPGPAPRAP